VATLACALGAAGCAGTLDVTRALTPEEASAARTRLAPAAVVRESKERIPIPPHADISPTKVSFGREGKYVHKLQQGDVIVAEADGSITAIRTAGGQEIRFVPNTAKSPPGSDEVTGELPQQRTEIALRPGDRIEMKGTLEEGETIGGATVVEDRPVGLLVGGALMFTLAYAPAVYVGASSPRSGDRVLLLPVVGPFIDWAGRPSCSPPPGVTSDVCAPETAVRVGLALSGGFQALGAILFFVGLPSSLVLVDKEGRRVEWEGTSLHGTF
jgi:hypothetical protein